MHFSLGITSIVFISTASRSIGRSLLWKGWADGRLTVASEPAVERIGVHGAAIAGLLLLLLPPPCRRSFIPKNRLFASKLLVALCRVMTRSGDCWFPAAAAPKSGLVGSFTGLLASKLLEASWRPWFCLGRCIRSPPERGPVPPC